MPKVSVIIPTYNYAHYISDAIDSVLAQTYNDFEIIVVDDGSTDNTRELLKKYGNKISYIYQANKGLSAARNTGIKTSNGEYLQFLDSDDYISPEKLEIQSGFLDAHPEIGWVYSDCCYADEKGNILRRLSDKFIKSNSRPPEGKIFHKLFLWNFIPVNAVLVRKKCMDAGLFDESLTSYEDGDFWFRVSAVYEVKYIDKPLVFVRLHEGSMVKDVVKIYSNKVKVLSKICKSYPSLVNLCKNELNKVMADCHNKVGFEYYRKGKFKESISELLDSIKQYPFQKKVYFYLLLAFLKSKFKNKKLL